MTKDETAEFEALAQKHGLDGAAIEALRAFIEKVGDAAYERGQGNIQDAMSGRL